jgi:hypothetical protein
LIYLINGSLTYKTKFSKYKETKSCPTEKNHLESLLSFAIV